MAAIEQQGASVAAASLAVPFVTAHGSLLDLDAITVTDLNSSNHTRLSNSLSASASAAQPAIRLQPNKPRVLRHQQLLWLGRQRCRFVLRQYEQGVRMAKDNSDLRVPLNDDPDATQAYDVEELMDDDKQQAATEHADDDDVQPHLSPQLSAYNDTPDQDSGQAGQDEQAATLVVDMVEDEPRREEDGAKPDSEPLGLLGEGSEASPIIMSLTSSHSSNGNDDEQAENEDDLHVLAAPAYSHSESTDATGSKKASARTRVKQPSIVVTAEEQRGSMEEEDREQRRKAEEERDRKLRQEVDEQKAAFEREVQSKAKQREEKRRREEEEERKQEDETGKRREQEEAARQRRARQEENETTKREAKEKREAEKREKARHEREQQEEAEEEAERMRRERARKEEEDKKAAEGERKKAEEDAIAAEEEAKRKQEADEAEREEQTRQEEKEKQRQRVATEKQRVQQMATSQLGWKSKPSKKGAAQHTSTTSPPSQKTPTTTTPPRGKRRVDAEETKVDDRKEVERKETNMPDTSEKAVEEKDGAEVSESTKVEEKKEAKGKREKRKSTGTADDTQQVESESRKRASRRKTAEVGRVVPVPISQPAEEQWDAADFSPANAEEQKTTVGTKQQQQSEQRVEEAKSDVEEAEPENPAVTTAERTDQPAVAAVPRSAHASLERDSSRGKRKRGEAQQEVQEEGQQSNGTEPENALVLTNQQQQHSSVAAAAGAEGDGGSNSIETPAIALYAKQKMRKKSRTTSKGDTPPLSQSGHEPTTSAETDSVDKTAVDSQQPPAEAATDKFASRSLATLAAMDVLEDMDVAQALTTDSMATTDEEVSPSNAVPAPKGDRRLSKTSASKKTAEEMATNTEAADKTTSETKATASRGKRKRVASVADGPTAGGEQHGTRYSHRTRSAGAVDSETAVDRTNSTASTPNHATRRTSSKSRTPIHSAAHTRSSSASVSLPLSSSPVLLFTAIDYAPYNADIERLHGSITTDPLAATHLITNKVRRTDKFLIAYSVTPHLQSLQWLEDSLRVGRWESEEAGRLVDEEAEAKWGFVLSERRVRSGWMDGWQVWCSDSVLPSRASMKGIVEAAGGRMREANVDAKRGREAEKDKVLLIGCEADKSACMEWTRAGFTVYDKEVLLTGVLRQRVDVDQHILYQAATGKQSAKAKKR